jgi:hypothetical protein
MNYLYLGGYAENWTREIRAYATNNELSALSGAERI